MGIIGLGPPALAWERAGVSAPPPWTTEVLEPVMRVAPGAVDVEVQGIVRVTVEPVGPQCLQNVTVVVQDAVEAATEDSVGDAEAVVGIGRVRVTMVGVGAQ